MEVLSRGPPLSFSHHPTLQSLRRRAFRAPRQVQVSCRSKRTSIVRTCLRVLRALVPQRLSERPSPKQLEAFETGAGKDALCRFHRFNWRLMTRVLSDCARVASRVIREHRSVIGAKLECALTVIKEPFIFVIWRASNYMSLLTV